MWLKDMKIIIIILISFILSSCYTQIVNEINIPDTPLPISDTTVFLPNENYSTVDYSIKDLYRNWINSREEENSVIKIYRPEDYKKFPLSRFRGRINFYENGECKYLVIGQGDRHKYMQARWRILKENPDIIYLYDDEGKKDKSFRIEELKEKLLKIVWVN
jgi:hypothetical protein